MMSAARRELWGGARQQSRFNNCGEGGPRILNCSPSRVREGHFFLVLGAAMLVWSSSMVLAPLTRYGVA